MNKTAKTSLADFSDTLGNIVGSDLLARLERVKENAPPPPKETLYSWLRKAYSVSRALTREERRALRLIGKKEMGIRTGNIPLRVIIELTAGAQGTPKMKLKYAARLNDSLKEDVKPKNLRRFIEKHGGINKTT